MTPEELTWAGAASEARRRAPCNGEGAVSGAGRASD